MQARILLSALFGATLAVACAAPGVRASEPEPRVVALERLGLVFAVDERGAVVTSVTDEGTAELDVSPGTRLVEIDGEATSGFSAAELERALERPDLASVTLDTGSQKLEIWLRPPEETPSSTARTDDPVRPAEPVQLELSSIETLTSGAPALERAFDERAGVVQLVMLLSPT